MALAIRLARGGMKKRPYYRIVVTDSRNARDGKFLEKIGTYNPLLAKDSPERVKLDGDRAAHWLSVGAQPSDRVARFLDAAGIRTRAAKLNPKKGEPGEKAKERAQIAIDKAAEAEEAAKQAEIDAKEAAEAAAAAEAEAAAAPVVDETPAPEVAAEEAAEVAGDDAAAAEEGADVVAADETVAEDAATDEEPTA